MAKSVNINPDIKKIIKKKYKIVRPTRLLITIGLLVAIAATGLILLTDPKAQTQMKQDIGSFNMQLDNGFFVKQEITNEGLCVKTTFTEEEAIKFYLAENFPRIDGSEYAEKYGWYATAEAIEDITDGVITVSHNYGPEKTREFYIEKSDVEVYNYNLNHPEKIVVGEQSTDTASKSSKAA